MNYFKSSSLVLGIIRLGAETKTIAKTKVILKVGLEIKVQEIDARKLLLLVKAFEGLSKNSLSTEFIGGFWQGL